MSRHHPEARRFFTQSACSKPATSQRCPSCLSTNTGVVRMTPLFRPGTLIRCAPGTIPRRTRRIKIVLRRRCRRGKYEAFLAIDFLCLSLYITGVQSHSGDPLAEPLRPGDLQLPLLGHHSHHVKGHGTEEITRVLLFHGVGGKLLRLGLLIAKSRLTVREVMIDQVELILRGEKL